MKLFLGTIIILMSFNSFAKDVKSESKSEGKTEGNNKPKAEAKQTGDRLSKTMPRPSKVPKDQVAIFINEKYEFISLAKQGQLTVNVNCLKMEKCLALEATKNLSKKVPSAPHPRVVNPAALYCATVGGSNYIAINSSAAEENYCRFSDSSFINAWDLYSKRFPTEEIN